MLFRQPLLASDRSSNYKSQVADERVIENCHTLAPIIETETCIIITDEIILVKNDGILPGADGFALLDVILSGVHEFVEVRMS